MKSYFVFQLSKMSVFPVSLSGFDPNNYSSCKKKKKVIEKCYGLRNGLLWAV